MTTSPSSGVTLVLSGGNAWNVPAGLTWEETPDITGTLAVIVFGAQPDDPNQGPPKLASCSGVEIVYAGASAVPAALSSTPARGL